MSDDKNKLSKRVGRYANVTKEASTATLKLLASKYLGIKIDENTHAGDIKKALGNLRGPLMKMAQILSTIPGILPEAYENELTELQSNAPSMGKLFVKRRLKGELGENWKTHFKELDLDASFAASLGQVHKAILEDGTHVACKLQYPDMSSAIEADLKQLKFFFKFIEIRAGIDTEDIFIEVADRLREELDYSRELRNITTFQNVFKKTKSVHIPETVDHLSTNRLLTMKWLDGERISTYFDAPLKTRNTLAKGLFHAWYMPLYTHGVIHGDPHLGNYTVGKDLTLNLLDFGCIRAFPGEFVGGIIDLYQALLKEDRDMMAEAYRSWGFENLNNDLIDTLGNWARYVYDPLLDNRKRRIQEHGGPEYGREVAVKTYKEIQKHGGVKPPREFVFVDRAAVGLGSAFLRLNAEINWHKEFEKLIDKFDAKKLDQRQKKALG